MWRVIFEPFAFFLAPFAVYFFYLLYRKRHPLKRESWSGGALSLLSLSGLFIAVCGMIFLGLTANREQGAYTPARSENGKVTPGRFQ